MTSRQKQVAELVSKGLTNKEIANSLGICERMVVLHLTAIYQKRGWYGHGSRFRLICTPAIVPVAGRTL